MLHVGHAEPDQQLSRILQVRVATADQIDGLLLLWRMGYPYASLTTSRELYVNEDGRLADTPLPLEWEQDIPVRLAGGDLNRDGYDDVLYFPAIDANWFCLKRCNSKPSNWSTASTFIGQPSSSSRNKIGAMCSESECEWCMVIRVFARSWYTWDAVTAFDSLTWRAR